MKILEMKNISKKFPGVLALKNVNFHANQGKIVGLIGENGAGKSTLMKIISGVYPSRSYEGELYINGKRVQFENPRQAEETGIEMIYQEINMHLDLSIAENLVMGKWNRTKFGFVDWQAMNESALCYLEMVDSKVDPREKMRNLSTSQQQLVAVARALYRNPKILVMDEPSDVLTETEAENLYARIHHLNEDQGLTIILISHKLNEIFEHTDRIVVMRDGEIVGDHEAKQVSHEQVIHEMVGRTVDVWDHKELIELGEEVLRVEHFSVQHPYTKHKNILEDVNFMLREREILGIAGLVGSGRSELLNAIFGKGGGISGEVFVHGKKVAIHSPRDAINYGIGMLTEDRKADGFIGVLSILKNISVADLQSISSKGIIKSNEEKQVTKKYVTGLSIRAPSTETLVNNLSGGNQQKVVLAKWMMTTPKILFLDEPTRGIDIGTKEEIYKIMGELSKQGISIIMISSELPELLALADRIIVIGNGKVRGELCREKFEQDKIMHLATAISDE